MSHFPATKWKPVSRFGQPGLTFANLEDNEKYALPGFVVFRSLDSHMQGVKAEELDEYTWAKYMEVKLNALIECGGDNFYRLNILKSFIRKGRYNEPEPTKMYMDMGIALSDEEFNEILNGISEENLYDYAKFIVK